MWAHHYEQVLQTSVVYYISLLLRLHFVFDDAQLNLLGPL